MPPAVQLCCELAPSDRIEVSHVDAEGDVSITFNADDDPLNGGIVVVSRARLKEFAEALLKVADGS